MKEINELRKKILDNDKFCFYPFLEISTRPNGVVFPCCYWTEQEHLSISKKISDTDSIESFWNGKKFISIRNSLANGETLRGCEVCHRDGEASMRARSIREYINSVEHLQIVNNTIKNEGIATHLPKRLELKPNNLCNLKCFKCNAYDSSQIEKELRELNAKFNGIKTHGGRFSNVESGNPGVWEGYVNEYELPEMLNLDWAETGFFWKDLEKIIPGLDVLSFAGGEPTVNPIVYKILEYCVNTEFSKNITVYISSNFTNLNKKFFDLMPKFKKFELIASIDGFGSVQEYIRFPSKWSMIKKNFEEARTYMKYDSVKILVNITVDICNVAYLTDLLDYLEEKFLEYPYYKEWPYNINLINYPKELRICWIPQNLRSEIIENIKSYQQRSRTIEFFPEIKIKTDLIINELQSDYEKYQAREQIYKLKKSIEILDDHRNISYKDAIPFLDRIFLSNEI